MDTLWPFIHQRKEVDGVKNAAINRALEIVRRILHLARIERSWETLEHNSTISLRSK